MSGAQFNIAMVLRADVAAAKAGLSDVATSLKAVSAEAGKTGAATSREAAELERMAAAAAKATRAQVDLVAAERNAQAARAQQLIAPLATPQQSAAPVVAFWRSSETAASSLRDTVAGLNVTIGQQAHEFVASAQATAQWRAAMDDVRASFNPLFAASRQYEQQLDRIAEAERLGAISAVEAAAARQRAAGMIAPVASGMSGAGVANSMHTANIGAQGFDIGVTAAMGMNPMMIGLQQGSQLVQVMQQMGGGKQALTGIAQGFLSILNPMSLATMGVVAFGALGIQALMSLRGETKTFREAMADLSEATESYARNIARARASSADLAADYGDAAEEVRNLIAAMAELDRRAVERSAKTVLGKISEDRDLWLPDLSWRKDNPNQDNNSQLYDSRRAIDRREMRGLFDLDRSKASSGLVDNVLDAMTEARTVKGAENQIAALEKLRLAWAAAAEAKGGYSEKEDSFLKDIQEVLGNLRKVAGLDGNAAGETEAKAVAKDLAQQVELERARLKFGQDSAEVRAVENSHERESLELKLEGLGLTRQDAEWARAMGALSDLQLQREQAALQVRQDWLRSKDDRLAAIRRETSLIGASAEEQARVNALAEAEIEIRDRNLGLLDAMRVRMRALATAAAEHDQARARAQKDLADAQTAEMFDAALAGTRDPRARAELEAQREYARQRADGVDPDIAAGNAALVRARAMRELQISQGEFLRGQDEGLAKLRLELALVGQTAEVRARVLALAQAEQDIQRLGLEGDQAEGLRRQALVQAELAQTIESQADAWRRVQSAGEAAIDGVLDKLRGGDIKGALSEMLGEIEKGFFDLAIRNPLKNALLGTNLGTWEDVGGWAGIWGRMSGTNPVDEGRLARDSVLPLQQMTVTATNVILQGNMSGLVGLAGGAANANAAPMGFAGPLPGSGDVQSQIWSFFAAKGLQPHQIAGIMGNVAGESGFNPLAQGDHKNGAAQAFGLFQWNDRKGSLFDFLGGQQNLGDVQKQLEFAWHELMTSENGAFRRLMGSTDVAGATDAFMRGFERPSDAAMSQSWAKRLAAAEQAAAQFGNSVQAAGAQVDAGGARAATGLAQAGQGAMVASQGMGAFGQILSGIGGMVGGKTGSILGAVVNIGGALLGGQKLFKAGGFTGGSDPDRAAGVVHEGEYVFDAVATRRIGVANLEGIRRGVTRGFRSGGYVGPSPAAAQAANAGSAPAGRSGVPLHVSVDVAGARGNREIEEMVQQAVSAGVSQGLDLYDREALPSRIRQISNDRWGG